MDRCEGCVEKEKRMSCRYRNRSDASSLAFLCIGEFPYIVHVYLVRVQRKVLHLPDTKLVGEVQHRTERSSGGQEHGSEGHFLG